MRTYQTHQLHAHFTLTTVPTRILLADKARTGIVFQSQHTNADYIHISSDGGNVDASCVELGVGGILYEDIIAPNGDIWASSPTAGTVLTVVIKY